MQPLCSSSVYSSTHHAFIKSPSRRKGDNPSSQQQEQSPKAVRFLPRPQNLIAAAAILTLSSPSLVHPPASIAEPAATSKGAALFHKSCIGCHDMGGNILQPGCHSLRQRPREERCRHRGGYIQHHVLWKG